MRDLQCPGLDTLPAPARAYVVAAGVVGRAPVHCVDLRQQGYFRMGPGQRWLPMTARQHFTADPPGFRWVGTIRPLPLVSATGEDVFAAGHGSLHVRLLSVFPLAEAHGPQTDEAEMQRFLGELAWLPTAWLSPWLRWEAVDDRSCRVVMDYGGTRAAVTLHFAADGHLGKVTADRYREDHGQFTRDPWTGRLWGFREAGGLLVPTGAEAAWELDSGEFSYFHADLTEIAYDGSRATVWKPSRAG